MTRYPMTNPKAKETTNKPTKITAAEASFNISITGTSDLLWIVHTNSDASVMPAPNVAPSITRRVRSGLKLLHIDSCTSRAVIVQQHGQVVHQHMQENPVVKLIVVEVGLNWKNQKRGQEAGR